MSLNQAGHSVTVFERADRAGGLLNVWNSEYETRKRSSRTSNSVTSARRN